MRKQIPKFVILAIMVLLANTMQESCDAKTQCPQNSICNFSLKTCKCAEGFIGHCNISAPSLTPNPATTEMNNSDIHYFSVSPLEVNQFLDIKIDICQFESRNPLVAYLWGQTGSQIDFNAGNTFVPSFHLLFENNCSYIVLTNIYFYSQRNGESEKLILGLQNQNEESVALQISVQEKRSIQIYISKNFAIVLLILLMISFCGCMVLNIFRRQRLLNRDQTLDFSQHHEDYNIEYFETQLPKTILSNISSVEVDCPICLQNIEKQEMVRKTPCEHIFHSTCLDQWCKKNVNCPVCRCDLTLDYIKTIKDSLRTARAVNQNKDYLKNWEEDIELEERCTGDNSSIRQEIL